MEGKFKEELESFLESECDDYGMSFTVEYNGDTASVVVSSEYNGRCIDLEFKYENRELLMEMYDGHWETVRWWDWQVKYFWMKVSPVLFSNN